MLLALACRRFFSLGPSIYTHCCRALTLVLAKLSCFLVRQQIGTASRGPPILTLPTVRYLVYVLGLCLTYSITAHPRTNLHGGHN